MAIHGLENPFSRILQNGLTSSIYSMQALPAWLCRLQPGLGIFVAGKYMVC